MNTKKLLALLLALVMVVGVLAACSHSSTSGPTSSFSSVGSFGSFMSTTYVSDTDAPVSSMAIEASLDGYELPMDVPTYSGNFVVLEKIADTDRNLKSYKVVSLYTGAVIKTFEESYTDEGNGAYTKVEYSVNFDSSIRNAPMYGVKKTTYKRTAEGEPSTISAFSLYDASGKAIFTDRPYWLTAEITVIPNNRTGEYSNMYVIEGKVYDFNDESCELTFKCDYPVGYSTDLFFTTNKTETYVYATGANGCINVMNTDFELVTTWTKPSKAEDVNWFALNNGNLFVQYSIELPSNAKEKEYDYYESSVTKYELVTEIFDIQTNTSEEILFQNQEGALYLNVGYNRSMLNANEDTKDMYLDSFDSIISAYSIIDKKISTAPADLKLFLFSETDTGYLFNNIKVVEDMMNIPKLIADNTFMVQTTYGYAITDAQGEVQKKLTSTEISGTSFGDYTVVAGKGIYNAAYELVYDFAAKNATIADMITDPICGSTLFILEYTGANSKLVGFKADGTVFDTGVTLNAAGEYDGKTINTTLFNGVYRITETIANDGVTYKDTFYNCNGKELASFDDLIYSNVRSGENATLFMETVENEDGGFTYNWYIVK